MIFDLDLWAAIARVRANKLRLWITDSLRNCVVFNACLVVPEAGRWQVSFPSAYGAMSPLHGWHNL